MLVLIFPYPAFPRFLPSLELLRACPRGSLEFIFLHLVGAEWDGNADVHWVWVFLGRGGNLEFLCIYGRESEESQAFSLAVHLYSALLSTIFPFFPQSSIVSLPFAPGVVGCCRNGYLKRQPLYLLCVCNICFE